MSITPLSAAAAVPRIGRPSPDAAAALPARILAASRDLFLKQGFAATSVQQIADRAGVTKRTLYVKVGDKEELLRRVVTDMLADWRRTVAAVGADGPLPCRLERIGLDLLRVLLAPDMVRLTRVLFSEAYRFPSLTRVLARQVEEGPVPQIARILAAARGAEAGPARQDEIAARLLYEMISGPPLRVALTGRTPLIEITLEEWVHDAVTLFLHGWGSPHGRAVDSTT